MNLRDFNAFLAQVAEKFFEMIEFKLDGYYDLIQLGEVYP
jgi:hypothetical protein